MRQVFFYRCFLLLLFLGVVNFRLDAQEDVKLLKQASFAIVSESYDAADAATLYKAAELFGLPALDSLATAYNNKIVDVEHRYSRSASAALLQYARERYGVGSLEFIYCNRCEAVANFQTNEGYACSLIEKNASDIKLLCEKNKTDDAAVMRLLCDLEFMMVKDVAESLSLHRWEKLRSLEDEVRNYLQRDKRATNEKIAICDYMAKLKDCVSMPFISYVSYIFANDTATYETPDCLLGEFFLTNSGYYYKLSVELCEELYGADAAFTLLKRMQRVEFLAARKFLPFEDAYAQLQELEQKLSSKLPEGDSNLSYIKILLWTCNVNYGKDNGDIAGYRQVLNDIAMFYGKKNSFYLNCAAQIMDMLLAYDKFLATCLQDEVLSLAKELYYDNPDVYWQYMYRCLAVTMLSGNSGDFVDSVAELERYYKKKYHTSWSFVGFAALLSDIYGRQMLLNDKETEYYKKAVDDIKVLAGEESPSYAFAHFEYVRLLYAIGRTNPDTMVELCKRCIEYFERCNIKTVYPYVTLANQYHIMRRSEEYKAILREGIEHCSGNEEVWRCCMLFQMAWQLYSEGDDNEAATYFEQGLLVFNEIEQLIAGEEFIIYTLLGNIHKFRNELLLAAEVFERGKLRHGELYGYYDANYMNFVSDLFALYAYELNNFDKAEDLLTGCLNELENNPYFSEYAIALELLMRYFQLIKEKAPNDLVRINYVWQQITKTGAAILANSGNNIDATFPVLKQIIFEMPFLFDIVSSSVAEIRKMGRENVPPEYLKLYDSIDSQIKNTKKNIAPMLDLVCDAMQRIEATDEKYIDNEEYARYSGIMYSYYAKIECDTAKAMGYLTHFLSSNNRKIATDALETIAGIHHNRGEYLLAAEKYERVLKESTIFTTLSQKAFLTDALIHSYYYSKLYEKAVPVALEYRRLRKQLIEQNFDLLTQIEREGFVNKGGAGSGWICNLLYRYPARLKNDAYNAMLEEKGLLLRASERVRRAVMQSGNADMMAALDSLNNLRSLYKTKDINYIDAEVVYLYKEIERLERRLNRFSAQNCKNNSAPDWKQLQGVMRDDEAAVEFVLSDTVACGALVLKKSGEPEYVYLSPNKELWDELVKLNEYSAKYKAELLYEDDVLRLYERLWQPLEPLLDGVSRVFFSPTGYLNELAFPAIKCGDGHCLADVYELHQMLSTGNLVELRENPVEGAVKRALVCGSIYYDAGQEELARSIALSDGDVLASDDWRGVVADDEEFGYLPFSRREVARVKQLLDENVADVKLLTGFEATEMAVREKGGGAPQLLHLATHGFFVHSDKEASENKFLARFHNTRYTAMQRSGLAFVDANAAWAGNYPDDEACDGIMTANEVAALDLGNVRLAVLSACRTAVGYYSPEGVYGMHRGFKQAGVRSILATLWNVNDHSTSRLMELFYENWLAGDTMQCAFTNAIKALRKEFSSPFYWAPFVLMDAVE